MSVTWKARVPISKIDSEQCRVYGVAMTSTDVNGILVVDHQNDVITPSDLEEAAYEYVRESRVGGVMHEPGATSDLIASVVLTPEVRKAMGVATGPTTWFVGYQINDPDAWARVKSGELTEFSIEGEATREPYEPQV